LTITAERPGHRVYGNFRRPVSAGVGRTLGLIGTVILFGGLLVVIFTIAIFGLLWALIPGAVVLTLLGLVSIRDRHHRNLLQRAVTRIGFTWARWKGATIYRSGPVGRVPYHGFHLPGLAADMRVSEWTDTLDQPFALMHHPADNSYSVAFVAEPEGAALVDDEQIDDWVADWGGFLASLGEEPNLVACAVIIETSPDSGTRLRTEVEANADPASHPVAQAMLRECVETYPAGAANVTGWIVPTFSGAASGTGKKRPTDEVATDLGTRLPGLYGDLASTGAGAVRPATVDVLAEEVRVAYDPVMAALFDAARAAGDDAALDWSEVGPSGTDARWKTLHHDGSVSVTYGMTSPPRGEVYSSVLARVLAPHPAIDRKRVVLLFEPIDPGRAPDVADRDVVNAKTRATAGAGGVSERAVNDLHAAKNNAESEARGAGLLNFGALVTITVTDPDRLPAAEAAIDNLIGTARLRCRPLYGSQDSAFVCGLPLGVVPWRHLRVPADLAEAM
jgi:hypothetical protein